MHETSRCLREGGSAIATRPSPDDPYAPWGVAARAAVLAAAPLFSQVPPERAHEVARCCRTQWIRRGVFLFREGESADDLQFVAAGRIKMIRETEDGQKVILRVLGPGEMFGGIGVWGVTPYPASAIAAEDTTVLHLPVSDFAALLGTHPDLGLALVRELAARLREAEVRITELQTERVERRLARALLRLANKVGARSAAGIELALSLSRQDLAELTGTTIGTVSRTLSAWERYGLVSTGRERITIRDAHGLVALAEDLPPQRHGDAG
jgi:CRP-like cAMP-binding protein